MTTSKRRKQRHHTVPRLHLRGFATREEMLVQLDGHRIRPNRAYNHCQLPKYFGGSHPAELTAGWV